MLATRSPDLRARSPSSAQERKFTVWTFLFTNAPTGFALAYGQARIARHFWYYSSERARTELGYRVRPFEATLADAFHWHAMRTRVTPRGANRWLFPPAV